MEGKFEQMAMAVASQQEIDADKKLADLKAQRDHVLKAFDFQISEVETEKNATKLQKEKMKLEEKENKIRTDMIQQMLEKESQGVFIGNKPAQPGFNPNPFTLMQDAGQNDQPIE